MPWNHNSDCLSGYKIFQPYWSTTRYFIIPFYKCGWWCEGMAWYRIQEAAIPALNEPILSYDLMPQSKVKGLVQRRGQKYDKGWLSFGLVGQDDKLVVAPPVVLNSQHSQPSKTLIVDIANLVIPMGIQRLSRAKTWRDDEPAGHTPLNIPAIEDLDRLKKAMDTVGMKHGRIYPARPVSILEEELIRELRIGEVGEL